MIWNIQYRGVHILDPQEKSGKLKKMNVVEKLKEMRNISGKSGKSFKLKKEIS